MAIIGVQRVMYVLAGGLVLGCIPASLASEPVGTVRGGIQFSEHELPRSLVAPGHDPLSRAARFESLPRGGSVGGVVGSLPAPSSSSMLQTPNARLRELMEQRRNWIYVTEPAANFGTSAEQAMGVRSYDLSEAANSPGGGLRDFSQRDRRPQQPASDVSLLFDNRRDGLMFDSYRVEDFATGGASRFLERRSAPELDASGQEGYLGISGLLTSPQWGQGTGSRSGSELGEEGRERSSPGLGSVGDLLRSPDNIQPMVRGFDPIDFRIDTTRQELNPTSAQRPLDGSTDRGTLDLLGNISQAQGGAAGLAVSGILDRLAPDEQGSASLAPVVRAPPDPWVARPVTRFGEFPSRRF